MTKIDHHPLYINNEGSHSPTTTIENSYKKCIRIEFVDNNTIDSKSFLGALTARFLDLVQAQIGMSEHSMAHLWIV